MQIIYETTNHLYKAWGIIPYRYIGSDEHDKPKYLGSSKKLKEDINILGKEFFEKKVLFRFDKGLGMTNADLRQKESELLISLDCAKDPTYYNRTNTCVKGYVPTEEEKAIIIEKLLDSWRKWFNNLSDEEHEKYLQEKSKSFNDYNNKIKGKDFMELYGEEKAKKLIESRSGDKNPKSKYDTFTKEDREKVKDLYSSGLYHKKELAEKYKVSLHTISENTKEITRYENNDHVTIIENGISKKIYLDDEYKKRDNTRSLDSMIVNIMNSRPIIIENVLYLSIIEAEKILNIKNTTILHRIKSDNVKFKNYQHCTDIDKINEIKDFYVNKLKQQENIIKKEVKETKVKKTKSIKCEKPPYEQLVQEIKELGYRGTGRKYGVSDNGIRKWKKNYENI